MMELAVVLKWLLFHQNQIELKFGYVCVFFSRLLPFRISNPHFPPFPMRCKLFKLKIISSELLLRKCLLCHCLILKKKVISFHIFKNESKMNPFPFAYFIKQYAPLTIIFYTKHEKSVHLFQTYCTFNRLRLRFERRKST